MGVTPDEHELGHDHLLQLNLIIRRMTALSLLRLRLQQNFNKTEMSLRLCGKRIVSRSCAEC
jgi:hypothetical protein